LKDKRVRHVKIQQSVTSRMENSRLREKSTQIATDLAKRQKKKLRPYFHRAERLLKTKYESHIYKITKHFMTRYHIFQ